MDLKALIPERSLADAIMVSRGWLDGEIAKATSERHRHIITQYRDHWWGEVIGDLEMVMATMAPDPYYRAYGSKAFGEFKINTTEETREFYAALFASGYYPAGAFTETRCAVADWGLMVEAVNTAIIPGSFFPNFNLVPAQAYKASWRLVGVHPFNKEGLMEAEILYVNDPHEIVAVER